jgi:hypothetical protein
MSAEPFDLPYLYELVDLPDLAVYYTKIDFVAAARRILGITELEASNAWCHFATDLSCLKKHTSVRDDEDGNPIVEMMCRLSYKDILRVKDDLDAAVEQASSGLT